MTYLSTLYQQEYTLTSVRVKLIDEEVEWTL